MPRHEGGTPMTTRSIRTGALACVAVLSMALGACSAGAAATPPSTASPPPVTATATSAPTPVPTPSATALIPDGTYAAAPMDVAAVKALINADTKLTVAEKNYIIDTAFELDSHKTFKVTLE